MKKEKRITYFLGAGASFYACPIWQEQGNAMIALARSYLQQNNYNFNNSKNPFGKENGDYILWDIGYFGYKAKKYHTIDAYARKLVLNNSDKELQRLKLAVSSFFTLWQLSGDLSIKDKNRYPDDIDRRYITLLAALLQPGNKDNNNNPILPDHINVVSWNYDLQFEFAYKSFCEDKRNWKDIRETLIFSYENIDSMQICHLNGYHGYYLTNESKKEVDILDRAESSNFKEILESISFTPLSQHQDSLYYGNHINYAWENNDITSSTRERAKKIFLETDILVVVGYSFPPFNKEIDKELFSQLKKEKIEIIYQDKNASPNFIGKLIDINAIKITFLKDKLDHFYFPY